MYITHLDCILSPEAGGPLTMYFGCQKNRENPGHHDKFIPISQFGVDSVGTPPPGLTKEEVVMWVLAWAKLVVRFHARSVSIQRPDIFIDGAPYPLAEYKGQDVGNLCGSAIIQ